MQGNGGRRSDSFVTLESDDEDNLLKALQAEKEQQRQEMEAHMDAAREAIKALEACEDGDAARTMAYDMMQSAEQPMIPYLMIELWLQMREMARECKASLTKTGTRMSSSPTTRAAERQLQAPNARPSGSKLGTVALPTAQDLQLPAEFDPEESSNESEGSNPHPTGEITDNGWKAVLEGVTTTTTATHQDLFNQLARAHPSQLQIASETEDDDGAELDVTATSFPLLTIQGNVQEQSGQRNDGHTQQHDRPKYALQTQSPSRSATTGGEIEEQHSASEFIDLGTLPFSDTSPDHAGKDERKVEIQAAQQRMTSLMAKFSRFSFQHEAQGVVEGDEEDFDQPVSSATTTDPTKRTNNTAIPSMLTSNDDLNEEITASLARLARIYRDDMTSAAPADLPFPQLSDLSKGPRKVPSQFVDKNGRTLEDDDNDVYQHYFGVDVDAMHRHMGYSFTVPTALELQSSRRAPATKKARRKAPTPSASSLTAPRKGVRSYARKDGNKGASSPLAQGPRRVSASSARRPSSAPQTGRPAPTRATASSTAKSARRPIAGAVTKRGTSTATTAAHTRRK